jgi:hypothetical protein
MLHTILLILLDLGLCFATFGFFYLGMHRRGIGYVENFQLTTLYFLVVAFFTSYLFIDVLARIPHLVTPTSLAVLSFFMLAQFVVTLSLTWRIGEPREYFLQFPDRYYLRIHWKRLISKSADIFAQQVFIVVLVMLLQDLGLSLFGITGSFFLLFALLHIPLISSEWGRWPAWLFGSIVVVFSILFPFMILRVPGGAVYNMIAHWLFYMITAIIFSVHKQRRSVL